MTLSLLLLATSARADDLDRARQLEAQLEYEKALAIVEGMLARGGADPARFADLHVFAGKLAAGIDRAAVAQDHFARALAVRPQTRLPAGTSPKIVAPFEAAKARVVPLAVEAKLIDGAIVLEVRDTVGLVAGIAMKLADEGGGSRELVERAALSITVPAGMRATEVAALDASGNRVWIGAPPASAPVTRSGGEPAIVMETGRPIYARWSTWAIATGVVAGGAGLAAWRFSVAQREWDELRDDAMPDFGRLRALEDRGERWGLVANIGFGVAAATAVTSIVLLVRGDRGEPATTMTITPGPGAAGLGVAGRF